MASSKIEDRARQKRDRAKRAVALAMQSRWSEAAEANLSLLSDFPDDLEAYNRLGKALTELGRVEEAKSAFQRALGLSPHNAIARKNLDRLMQLGDDVPSSQTKASSAPHTFIEESGKAGVTALINLASQKLLLKMTPGNPINLEVEGAGLKVRDASGEYVGQVEPKLASRLVRLIKGGNRYEATVTSVGGQELTVIIREAYQHPSQAETVSFPFRGGPDQRAYLPSTILGYDVGDEDSVETGPVAVKDWSDDDTEPGDDDAFSPVVHRIINPGVNKGGEEEDF